MQLESLLEATKELPSIPKLVQELISSFQDEQADINAISEKIALDQTLTARVLRLANSPWFGFSREVATIKDAAVLLGFNHLRTLVLACGITSSFNYPAGFNPKQFWDKSFTIASLAQWLSQYGEIDAQEAFTCGMLHNIGLVLIAIKTPEHYQKIIALDDSPEENEATERRMLGFCTTELSSFIAKSWHFPDSIQEALRWQNSPQGETQGNQLATVLFLAQLIEGHKSCNDDGSIEANMPLFLCQQAGIDAAGILTDIEEAMALQNPFASLLL